MSLFVWLLPLNLSGMGAHTSSYATAGIAFRVSGALKPHHHDKVETSSVENNETWRLKNTVFWDVTSCNTVEVGGLVSDYTASHPGN
jgi:hypothetical protein